MQWQGDQTQGTSWVSKLHWWMLILFSGLMLAVGLVVDQWTHFTPKWLSVDSSSIFEWAGYFLALFALTLAIKTDRGVAETLKRTDETLTRIGAAHAGIEKALTEIEKWAKAMPTRHVGAFPQHLEEICRLVRETKDGGRLDIVADCVDYGSFYAPESYAKIMDALTNAKTRRVTIRYLACGPIHRFTANSPYFGKDVSKMPEDERTKFFDELKLYLNLAHEDKQFRNKLAECLDDQRAERDLLIKWLKDFTDPKEGVNWQTECPPLLLYVDGLNSSQPPEGLLNCKRGFDFLLFVHEWFNEGWLTKLATLKRISQEAPLFMWLRDADRDSNGEAVFVLPSPITRGFGFRTLDVELIRSLASTFEHYWNLNSKQDGPILS